jgi:hypothetical protein
MQDLITRLQSEAGLEPAKAQLALDVVKNYTKEKFPMFADAIDKLFEEGVDEQDDILD